MYNPPHPGEILRELYLQPLDLSITAAAEALGVSRNTLSELVNGARGVSPEMALRLSMAFDTTPDSWMEMQSQYDLWHAFLKAKKHKLKVRQLHTA
jgi:addiction module HigA family antidote